MSKVDEAVATFERNIAAQTGRSVEDWAALIRTRAELVKHGQMLAWLKGEHGLSHGYANHIAKRATAVETAPGEDPVDALYAGKEALRPIHDKLVAAITAFGLDVEFAPKKANISVRRRRQFALIQPTTKTRLDLGLILKREPTARLEPSGSFNAMFTHRVKLASVDEVDAELLGWLREAYDAAG